MKSKASYEEHLLSNSISAGLNHKKPRSNTLFNHNVKYSPSIFKQKVTKENSLSKIDVKDIGFEIKTQLTDKIKSLIDSPKMFTKFNLTLEEITPAGSNTSQKAQAITIGRQKILAKYKKIGNNETLIEFLDIIKNISIIVTKNTYCHSNNFYNIIMFSRKYYFYYILIFLKNLELELKIDDVKKKLKSRPFIPGFSKVSIETLNFIGEFMLLLEKFNINGHKYIILLKNQNSDLYSSDKKKKIEKTGLSLTDEEKLINLKEKNTNKIKKALKIYSKVSSVKASINNFNPESPKDNSNIDIDESPRRLSSQSLLRDDSFLESQPSNSNYDKNLKLRPNFYSYKTGKNDKYFYDSSDDDKSLSVNESLNQKSILDSEIEDELEKLEKDKKCFSDSLSNVKVTYDFQIEKYFF